jgi:CDP-diacylglycerol--serine O-phosphatidyltransferase
LFIVLAGIFDMLDGVIARLVRSTSEFGVELDSLCDAVSFGLAPSVLLWTAFYHEWLNWGLLIAAIPALAAVLRLARFNVQLTSMEDKVYFRGMPVPAGAFTIVSYVIFTHGTFTIPESAKGLVLTAVVVLVSLAMLSTIKYDNIPRPTQAELRRRPVVFVVFLAAVIASVATSGQAIFPFMVLYVVVGAVRHAYHLFRGKRGEDDDDTLEEPDPDPFSM